MFLITKLFDKTIYFNLPLNFKFLGKTSRTYRMGHKNEIELFWANFVTSKNQF